MQNNEYSSECIQTTSDTGNSNTNNWMRVISFVKKNTLGLVLVIAIIITVIVSINIVNLTKTKGKETLKESYLNAKEEAKQDMIQTIYDYYWEKAEEKFHVSNDAYIVVSNIQQISKIEVLKVCETDYFIRNKDDNDLNVRLWMKYSAKGVFTIDMTQAEFVKDEKHNCIYVRIPQPKFSDMTIETEEELFYKNDFLPNSSGASISLKEETKKQAYDRFSESIMSNQEYIAEANIQGIRIIKNMIRNMNYYNKDLDIIVEYVD